MKWTRLRTVAAIMVGMLLALTAGTLSPVVAGGTRTTSTANWLQYRSDNRRSGFNPYETQITPANVGSLRLTKIVGFPFDGPTPPLVYGNTLYTVTRTFIDPNSFFLFEKDESTLYALDSVTGRTKWSQTINCSEGVPNAVPAISATARVLILPMDKGCDTPSGDGHLLGLDLATGSVIWNDPSFQSWGNPAVLGGNVFVRRAFIGALGVSSINAASGAHNWDYDTGNPFGDLSVGGGRVYFPENVDGVQMLTSLDATTGAWLWTKGSATGVPTLGDGRIFVGCDQGICSYNQSGDLKWSFAAGKGPLAYANGTVYVGCYTEALCALDGKTGAPLWAGAASVGDLQHHLTTITVANGIVFANVAYFGAPLYDTLGFVAISASTGEQIASFGPGAARGASFGELPNDLAVVNGHVYLVNENRLYIFSLS